MKILKTIFFIAMIAFGLFSVGCFLYPTISNQINEHYNESTINEYNRNVNTSSDSEIHAELQKAAQYNKVIATDFFDGSNEEYEKILNDYFDILDVDDGIMGTIEIPSIKVKLPVYHGESEDVLKKGAAHLEKTSFPIGGIDTRACVSAHSGYPSQKFFDDIDELISDDIIYIRILNQKLTYKVFDKEVVEPDDITKLKVEHGKELLTLMIERCFPDYQVVLATHQDREHIHNHFIINSVNLIDGKKFYENKSTLRLIRKVSDELCYRHNLSVIEKEDATKYSPLDQATLNAAKQGRSWKFNLVKDLDAALDSCKTKSEFIRFFESKNYEIKFTPQNITFRKTGNKKGIRADTLAKQFGRKYSKSSIEKKLNIASPTAKPKQPQNQQQRFQIPNYDYYNQLAAVNWKRYEKKYAERIKVPKRIYANPNLFARNPFVFTLRLIRFICNLKGNKPKQKIKSYSTVYKTYSYVDYKNGKKIIGNIPYKTIVNTFGEAVQIKLYAWQISRLLNNSILLSSRVDLKTGTGMTTIKKTDLPRVAVVLGVPTESFVKQAELIRNRKITAELKRHNLNLCYLRVSSDQVATLRERCVTFACYQKGDNFNIAFAPEDKDRVLDILYPDRGKQNNREDTFFKRNAAINRAIKSKAKETGEKICYKVVFANQYKQLRNTTLEFAVFRTKDGKYNVVFLESQKAAIEAALKGNAPTARYRKPKL